MPIDIGKQTINQILRNEKVLSAKWLSYFNSTVFAFLADVIYKEPLKWYFLLILCSLLVLMFELKIEILVSVGGGHHIATYFS